MRRVSVSLTDKLLDEINKEAQKEGINRSVLIRAVLENCMMSKRHRRPERVKRKKMEDASRKMDGLAKRLGKWNPKAMIRKFRDNNLKGDH